MIANTHKRSSVVAKAYSLLKDEVQKGYRDVVEQGTPISPRKDSTASASNGQSKDADIIAQEVAEEQKLESFVEVFKSKYKDLINSFRPKADDPILYKLDAFSIINWGLREVPHTKILAYFLDSRKEHGLGIWPIKYFLKCLALNIPEKTKVGLIDIENTKVEVKAECFINKEDKLDILIKIDADKLKWHLVIEGKIEMKVDTKQLKRYERKFSPKRDMLLLLLKDHMAENISKRWYPIRWLQIARALTAMTYDPNFIEHVTNSIDARHGLELLRLWLSTVFHHVCDIETPQFSETEDTESIKSLVDIGSHLREIRDKYI